MRVPILLLTLLAFSCTESNQNQQNKLSPDAFEQMIQADAKVQLVDVRTPEEFQSGHIEDALNLNVQDPEFDQKISQLETDRPVMVYCAVGGRSATAAAHFSKAGFPKVYDLKGGITAWKQAGKPLK